MRDRWIEFAVALMLAASASWAGDRIVMEGILVRVNDRIVTVSEFSERVRQELTQLPNPPSTDEEMREFERTLPSFRFVPALSEPGEGEEWEGETGLITEVVDRHVPTGENVEAYLCGSPGMIDACVKVLTAKGVPESLIYYDKFA